MIDNEHKYSNYYLIRDIMINRAYKHEVSMLI